jgi:hypothetical protein
LKRKRVLLFYSRVLQMQESLLMKIWIRLQIKKGVFCMY